MDLLNDNRSLIHTGKFLRQSDTIFEWNGWTELFALLFDNYCKGQSLICLPGHTHEASNSCYDETQGEGRRHEIPSVPTGNSGLIWHRIQFFLYGV